MKNQEVKYDAGKLRYDLVQYDVLNEYVRVFTVGSGKYGDNTWQNVEPERYEAALMRHFSDHMQGKVLSDDDKLYHLACVMWNAGALLWFKLQKEKEEERKKAYELHRFSIADALNSQLAAISAEQEAQRRKFWAERADRAHEGDAKRPEICESKPDCGDEKPKEHGFETERY